ncbi:hypothetical protein ACWE42_12115 [Sutcliffiella cohnii]
MKMRKNSNRTAIDYILVHHVHADNVSFPIENDIFEVYIGVLGGVHNVASLLKE